MSLRLRFEGTVMRSQTKGANRDLVEELIGEESENDFTHKPDGSYEILNDIVVDRGPNPSTSLSSLHSSHIPLIEIQQCQPSKSSATTNTSQRCKRTVSA